MMPRALTAGGLAAVLLLAGCSQESDAGGRVTPTPSGTSAPRPVESAPADLVAAAELVDCPATDPEVEAREDLATLLAAAGRFTDIAGNANTASASASKDYVVPPPPPPPSLPAQSRPTTAMISRLDRAHSTNSS